VGPEELLYGAEATTDEVAPFFHISVLRRAQQALAGEPSTA
jgi:hypothetical protein